MTGAGVLGPIVFWALAASTTTLAQEGFAWRPEDRVILTAFHLVSGMVRDERSLYVATEGGLQILDLFSERWETPSTAEDGYPVSEGPSAVAYDPSSRVVWLGTMAGTLHAFQTDFQRWRLEAAPGLGPVLALVAVTGDLDGGVLFRTPTGWFRLSPFGGITEPVAPARLPPEARLRSLPAAERLARIEPAYGAVRGTLTTDGAGRTWPLSDFARGDGAQEYWLGTAGDHVYRYDARFFDAEARRFGLLTPGAGAMTGKGGWLWIGGDGRGPRRGPVRVRFDLQEWTQYESGIVSSPPERIDDVREHGGAVWFAAPSGLYRLDPENDTWLHVGAPLGRLPVRRIRPVSGGGLWVATERGLARVGRDGDVEAMYFPGRAVRAVAEGDGRVWLGGESGLIAMDPDGTVQAMPPEAPPSPQGPIVDLASDRGTLWAATADALWTLEDDAWAGPFREVTGEVGRIRRLRVTGESLWVVGDGGVSRRIADGSGWRTLAVGRDLPEGPALDVLVHDDEVFVSTPIGVVRLQRRRGF